MAQALYDSGPTEEQAAQLATFGLTLDDFEQEVVEIWPENLLPMQVFQAMGTQWRMGFNGPVGLDYNVLPMMIKQLGVPKKERKRVLGDVMVMERAALRAMKE
ncbi:DUF1799 domain-containing protein [Paenalcaligenes hominis]|nr:DUF1799 domain-containing protein [Paenalcaligenes hominis]